MSLQKQQAWRTGGRAGWMGWGVGGGSLGFVDSPRPPPPPPWTKPPQLRAWPSNLAGSLGPLRTLSFGALRLRARTAAATCPRSKVTFVRRNRLLRGLEQLLLDGGRRCGKYVGGPAGRVSEGQTVARLIWLAGRRRASFTVWMVRVGTCTSLWSASVRG